MPTRSAEPIRAKVKLVAVLLLLTTQPSSAIQLRWSTGATDLTVLQNTQAVLVVQADSAEAALPNSWRLQWTADSLGIQFSPFEQACLVDTAKVDSIALPLSPADSAANQITAFFCSSGSSNAATAYFVVDLPAGGHGKLKVMALDPSDTTQVTESNEATINGGIDGDYAPLILRATAIHQLAQFSVTVEGAGLAGTEGLNLVAADASWRFPLIVDARSSSHIHASAVLAAPLPACTIEATTGGGAVAFTELSADSVPTPEMPEDY